MPRYRVSGLPPAAQRGTSAFFPYFHRLAASGAQQYKDGVTGHPGQPGIPISGANAPVTDRTSLALKGTASSSDAPWVIWPGKYWAMPERNYRPGLLVQTYDPVAPQDTTMIPVPATSLRQHYLRRSAALSGGIEPGGSSARQVKLWPKLLRWPGRSVGNGMPSG